MTVHSIHYSWICKVHILSSTKLVITNSCTGNLSPATVIVKHTLTNSTLTLLLTSLSLITNTLNSRGKSQKHYIRETTQTRLNEVYAIWPKCLVLVMIVELAGLSTLIIYLSYLLHAVYLVNDLTKTYILFCMYMVGIVWKHRLHEMWIFKSESLVWQLWHKAFLLQFIYLICGTC